jgi:ABC-2 type transport system ATP-binding protein
MMGLTPKEARKRLGAVLEFAELEEFADLKLKNYSSGMLVRLAFSAMIQADADVMLIDEVLAVGDASFQQKCLDVFHDMRASGKTVVLVTHDMNTVEEFCDRAMLIHDGEVRHIGEPEEVSRRYFRLNFGAGTEGAPRADFTRVEGDARVNDFWLTNGSGERVRNIEQRETIRLRAIVEARRPVERPGVGFLITNMDDIAVYGFGSPLQLTEESHGTLEPGEGVRVAGTIENRLSPGRYYVTLIICRNANMTDVVLRLPKALDFVVYGPDGGAGVVSLKSDLEAFPDDGSWD